MICLLYKSIIFHNYVSFIANVFSDTSVSEIVFHGADRGGSGEGESESRFNNVFTNMCSLLETAQ